MKPNKLSFSQIRSYSTCGRQFELHYRHRYRNIYSSAALCFGSAIDEGLNTLLHTRDLEKSIEKFNEVWYEQEINRKKTIIPTHPRIVYSNTDFDADLLSEDDITAIQCFFEDNDIHKHVLEYFTELKEKKDMFGFKNMSEMERKVYNLVCWHSLRQKGLLMLRDYNLEVMPHIKEVKAVQHKTTMKNDDGDEVVQVLDLIAVWEDGSVILFDNKTSSRLYSEDEATTSQQLISYYYNNKEQFDLTAVGFIVLNKHIQKNKVKTCTKCNKVSDNNRVKTCAIEIDGVRCGGAFEEKMNPKTKIQIIVSPVSDNALDLVLTTFDEANSGIRNENFYRNLLACKQNNIVCDYYEYCWKGDASNLIKLEEHE